MEKQTFVVALLSYLKPVGHVILPYSCSIENDKFITIYERITELNGAQYPDLSQGEKELVKLSESYSNTALIKQFSKNKKLLPKDFFATLELKVLDDLVRPYVEKRVSKIIEIVHKEKILIYKGGDSINLYPEDRITVEDETTQASLKFVRTAEGTKYKLKVTHADEDIKLNHPENRVIVNFPCLYLAENRLLHFDESITGKLFQPFFNKEFVAIPPRMEFQYFNTFIKKVANRCDVEAEGFQINDLQHEPQSILSLETDWTNRIVLVLSFKYGERQVLANNPQKTFTTLLANEDGFVFNRTRRRRNWEEAQIAFLKSNNLRQVEATFMLNETGVALHNSYHLIEWLAAHREALSLYGFTVVQPAQIKYLLEVPVINMSVKRTNDWFDIYGTVILKEHEIPFIKFRNHIINNVKEYELPTGEIVLLPDEWFSRYQSILRHAKELGTGYQLSKYHFSLMVDLSIPEAQQLEKALSNPEPAKLPALKNVTIRPYQIAGFHWLQALRTHGMGGILADDMGLGKTLQTIALLASVYPEREEIEELDVAPSDKPTSGQVVQLDLFAPAEPAPVATTAIQKHPAPVRYYAASLIVLPASLIHNWLNEMTRFAPWFKVYVHTGSNRASSSIAFRQYDIVLTTYGTMRNDLEILAPYVFEYVILDESQTIKNPESKSTQAAFILQARHRLVLTGTPIQNSLSDMWSQFNFLNPGMLGTHQHFYNYYEARLLRNREDAVADKLKALLKPFILRRTKEDVAPELPPLSETMVYCTMTDEQQSLYESEKSKVRNLILDTFKSGDIKKSSVMVLKALMLLRQLANHPRMIDKTSDAGSGKFKEVTESLETVLSENHKVLLFSSYVRHLKLIEEFCNERGLKYAMLTGATTQRERVINTFKNDSDTSLFLISLKAGGVGLNLTEADYVFILDPWWNPAAEMQALNRAHRIGQDKNVFVYRFITKETVEEKIVKLQQQKKDLADLFVTTDTSIAGMSREEILSIFA